MKQPSVLFINRVYPPHRGASGRMLYDLSRAFREDGWHVTVLTTGPERAKETLASGIEVRRVKGVLRHKTARAYMLIWLRLFLAGLRLPRHQLVVSMSDPPLLLVASHYIAKVKNSYHMHWCQDVYPDLLPKLGKAPPGFIMRILTRVSRRLMKRCDKVVAIGRCMARYLTHSGVEPARVAVIPNWAGPELTGDRKNRRQQKARTHFNTVETDRELYGDSRPRFRVLYAGKLGLAHPVATILDAAEILQQDYDDIEFVFAGNGAGHNHVAEERSRRGIDNIRMLPRQPIERLPGLMESGDMHFVTMPQDCAGLFVPCKMYSALAVKRPIILVGPDDSEVGRVVQDFSAGAVVAQGDAQALARVIAHYRDDGESWFAAHEGAIKAREVFVPAESRGAWLERARALINSGGAGL